MSILIRGMKMGLKYAVSMVVCESCGHKWVAVRPDSVADEKLQCPQCKKRGAKEVREVEE